MSKTQTHYEPADAGVTRIQFFEDDHEVTIEGPTAAATPGVAHLVRTGLLKEAKAKPATGKEG